MNIPIAIISVTLAAFFTLFTTLIGLMISAYTKNTTAFNEMKEVIAVIKTELRNDKESEKGKHDVINKRLDCHSDKISDHEIRIVKVESIKNRRKKP